MRILISGKYLYYFAGLDHYQMDSQKNLEDSSQDKSAQKCLSQKPKRGQWIVKMEKLRKCHQCNVYFTTAIHFDKHQQRHLEERKKVTNEKVLAKSVKTCDFCKELYPSIETLREHIKDLHMKTFYDFYESPYSTKDDNNLAVDFQAEKCNPKNFEVSTIKEHSGSHEPINEETDSKVRENLRIKIFYCKKCDNGFCNKGNFKRHVRSVHQNQLPTV